MTRATDDDLAAGWPTDAWDDPDGLRLDQVETAPPQRRTGRRLALAAGAVVLAIVLGLGLGGIWVMHQVNPSGAAGAPVTFTVAPGETLGSVADRLEAQKFISSATIFSWYVGFKGGLTPQAGTFSLRPDDSMGNLLNALKTSPQLSSVKVTFPEGFTLAQIIQRVTAAVPRLSPDTFSQLLAAGTVRSPYQPEAVTNLEGVVFPDTYLVSGNEDEATVLQRMVEQMQRVGAQVGLDQSMTKVARTPYEVLVVASLIEREAKVPGDRAKIARVIYNRLFLNATLDIDAALSYGQDPKLTFAQLKALSSPYNLYKVKGLPPTPIAAPGRASIEAALNPATGPWLYYVLANKDGSHVFAATLAEQNANIAKARADGVIP